jgi:hypothetical protein
MSTQIGGQRRQNVNHALVAIVVDGVRSRVYDSRYLVTTYAPCGRASHLRSPASTSTRANFAAAFEPRLNAVLDTFTVQEQWQSRIYEDRSDRPRSSPRGACRFGSGRRSRRAERVVVNGLRTWATSHRRHRDVVRPASCRGDGRPGMRVGRLRESHDQRVGLDSASHVCAGHPRRRRALNSPRSSARRPAPSATAWRPSSFFPNNAYRFALEIESGDCSPR